MVENLDENVGRILDKLAELKLDENTIVIFTSDNGGLSTAELGLAGAAARWAMTEGSPTSNLPLRAGKGWAYEGGVREPLLVKWPGTTRPGSVCPKPVASRIFPHHPRHGRAAASSAAAPRRHDPRART